MSGRWHLAVHEAGHAVVGRALGTVCGSVTVLADDDAAGSSVTADPWMILYQWELRGRFRDAGTVFRGRIMTFMAGAEAEVALLGSCQGGDGDDRLQAQLMLDQLGGGEHLEARLRKATRAVVRRHVGKIDSLAKALWTAGTIETDDGIRAAAGLPPAPSIHGGISALASAQAPFIFFDNVPMFDLRHGVGHITVTAGRNAALTPDGSGALTDHVITGLLRVPVPVPAQLREAIDRIEKMAADELAAAVNAATGGSPSPTAH